MLMGETRLYLHLSIFIGCRDQFNHDDNSHKHEFFSLLGLVSQFTRAPLLWRWVKSLGYIEVQGPNMLSQTNKFHLLIESTSISSTFHSIF